MQKTSFDKTNSNGLAITAAGAVMWGLSGCFGQYLFQQKGIDAAWLVSVRLLVSGILLTAAGFMLHGKGNLTIFKNKRDTFRLVRFAFLGLWFCQFTYFYAVQHSNAGTATVLQTTAPVLILLVECLRDKRAPRAFDLGTIAAVLCGVFLLSTHGQPGSMALSNSALFYGLLSSVAAACYSMMGASLLPRYGVYQTVGWGMLISGIAFALVIKPWNTLPPLDAATLISLAGVVILGTTLAFALFLQGASIIGPLPAMLVGSLEPLVAIIVAVTFLDSPFVFADAIGVVIILGAVTLLGLRQSKRKPVKTKA